MSEHEDDANLNATLENFEDVSEDEEGLETPPLPPPSPPPPPPVNKDRKPPPLPPPAKTYSQDEVNRMLAEDRRKSQKNRDVLIKNLQTIQQNAQLTKEEKDGLESQIEQLRNETLSRQEVEKKEREKLVREYQKQLAAKDAERDDWRTRYTKEKIERELTDAAIAYKAITPGQVVSLVKPETKLVEELKDGIPTGEWATRVSFPDKNERGEAIILQLSPTEAIKRMSEMDDHWNLFNSGAQSGMGSFNQNVANITLRNTPVPKNPEDYRRWRAANMTARNGKK